MTETQSDKKILIIKFGGRTLLDGERIRENALKIARIATTSRVVVVVSAMGDETSRLIGLAHEVTGGSPTPDDTIRVASMGEMKSATLFSAALEACGIRSKAILPFDANWPVIVSETKAEVLSMEKINEDRRLHIHEKESKKRLEEGLVPLINEGIVPVVCGSSLINWLTLAY